MNRILRACSLHHMNRILRAYSLHHMNRILRAYSLHHMNRILRAYLFAPSYEPHFAGFSSHQTQKSLMPYASLSAIPQSVPVGPTNQCPPLIGHTNKRTRCTYWAYFSTSSSLVVYVEQQSPAGGAVVVTPIIQIVQRARPAHCLFGLDVLQLNFFFFLFRTRPTVRNRRRAGREAEAQSPAGTTVPTTFLYRRHQQACL
ncbi:hypothetical protein F4861DRAFT_415770 [Xylaria intraflava]|nr:hypothetical protein F4861DRAFT_415770 [Xylaria intraflava]